ncbi:MAG: PQQ-dependent sugar dehydrogenase [bacterium]
MRVPAFRMPQLLLLVAVLFCCQFGFAQTVPEGFAVVDVNTALDNDADGFALLPDGRILLVHQFSGQVKLLVNGVLKSTPLLTVPNLKTSSEKGLLGIAVDPDFPDQPFIYLFHSHSSNTNRVSRFTVSGDLPDPDSDQLAIDGNSQLTLIDDLPAGAANHNGGTLRFGSDRTLYVSHGDDGNRDLVQNLTTLNGKILRINRDGSIPADNPTFPNAPQNQRAEIFAFGLRNPFRFAVDPQTDQLFIGDVGQDAVEEFDLSSGGENFGWPRFEGSSTFNSGANLIAPDPLFPIWEYNDVSGLNSGIALVAYRQRDFPNDASFPPEFDGTYFYADFYRDWIRNIRPDGVGGWTSVDFGSGFSSPVDGALGADGSFYLLEYGQALRKIVFNGTAVPVALSSFQGKVVGNSVLLSWRTGRPFTSFGFEVQRSFNAREFEKIGFVQGVGGVPSPTFYSFQDRDVRTSPVFYRLKQSKADGTFEFSQTIRVEIALPVDFELRQNFPNPFNPSTKISFKLPASKVASSGQQRAVLTILDVKGRDVVKLVDEELAPGVYSRKWDGRNQRGERVASGLYVYNLKYGDLSQSRKMIFAK